MSAIEENDGWGCNEAEAGGLQQENWDSPPEHSSSPSDASSNSNAARVVDFECDEVALPEYLMTALTKAAEAVYDELQEHFPWKEVWTVVTAHANEGDNGIDKMLWLRISKLASLDLFEILRVKEQNKACKTPSVRVVSDDASQAYSVAVETEKRDRKRRLSGGASTLRLNDSPAPSSNLFVTPVGRAPLRGHPNTVGGIQKPLFDSHSNGPSPIPQRPASGTPRPDTRNASFGYAASGGGGPSKVPKTNGDLLHSPTTFISSKGASTQFETENAVRTYLQGCFPIFFGPTEQQINAALHQVPHSMRSELTNFKNCAKREVLKQLDVPVVRRGFFKVLPQIFLGSLETAEYQIELKRNKITHVVLLTEVDLNAAMVLFSDFDSDPLAVVSCLEEAQQFDRHIYRRKVLEALQFIVDTRKNDPNAAIAVVDDSDCVNRGGQLLTVLVFWLMRVVHKRNWNDFLFAARVVKGAHPDFCLPYIRDVTPTNGSFDAGVGPPTNDADTDICLTDVGNPTFNDHDPETEDTLLVVSPRHHDFYPGEGVARQDSIDKLESIFTADTYSLDDVHFIDELERRFRQWTKEECHLKSTAYSLWRRLVNLSNMKEPPKIPVRHTQPLSGTSGWQKHDPENTAANTDFPKPPAAPIVGIGFKT